MSPRKHLLQFTLDTALIVSAYTLAFLFRFDFQLPPPYREAFLQGLCTVALVKPVLFLSMGFYRKLWRYASLRDVRRAEDGAAPGQNPAHVGKGEGFHFAGLD